MYEFALVAAVAAGAFAIRWLTRGGHAARAAEMDLWSRAAQLVGGEMAGGSSRLPEPALEVEIDDVRLVVRTRTVTTGRTTTRSTLAHAMPLPGRASFRLEVTPRDTVRTIAQPILDVFGAETVTTGDDRFDAAFDVRSSPTALAREVLDGGLRALLLDVRQAFVVNDGELTCEREGAPAEVDVLVAFTRFAERLVRAWLDAANGPAHVARALEWVPSAASAPEPGGGAVIARGARRGVACELVVRFRDEWALTVLRVLAPGGAGDFSIVRDAEATSGFTETGAVPDAFRALVRTAPRVLVGVRREADAVELAFDGLRPEPAAIVTALEATLAASVDGAPYR